MPQIKNKKTGLTQNITAEALNTPNSFNKDVWEVVGDKPSDVSKADNSYFSVGGLQPGQIPTVPASKAPDATKSEQQMADAGYQADKTPSYLASKSPVDSTKDIKAEADDMTKKLDAFQQESSQESELQKQARALQAKADMMGTITSAEQSIIDRAGQEAASSFDEEIARLEREKLQGLGISEVRAGEAGGFLNSQFVGAGAFPGITPEMAKTMGRFGTGGELARIKSEYDAVISAMKSKQQTAKTNAIAAAKTSIQTGKQQDFENAEKAFQAYRQAVKDEQQYNLDTKKYELDMRKYLSGEIHANLEDDIKKAKDKRDLAALTGKIDGEDTLEQKKFLLDDFYKRKGIELDEKTLNHQIENDSYGTWYQQQQIEIDKDKADAEKAGVDIEQSVKDALNGLEGIKQGQPGYNAYKQELNRQKTILKDEAKLTGNVAYSMKASTGGKALTQTAKDIITKTKQAFNASETLKQEFDNVAKQNKIGVIKGKLNSANFWDNDVQTLKASITSAVPLFARGIYGEVGVLTDNDIALYKKTLPGMATTEEAVRFIFANTQRNLAQKLKNTLLSETQGGADTSEFADEFKNTYNKLMGDYNVVAVGRGLPREQLLTASTNPAIYNSLGEFRNELGESRYSKWVEENGNIMDSYQIEDPEDYFDFLREQSINKDLLKDSASFQAETNSGDSGGLDFKSVGGDTDKASNIGKLSEKYESGGNPGAIGYDSTGGYSYGTYQLAHNNADAFIKQSKYAKEFKGIPFNSKEFQNKWKEIADREPNEFKSAQKNYISKKFYTPQLEKLANSGIDVNKMSQVVADVVWSTAVQHGGNTNIVINAYNKSKKELGREPSDKELITKIYNERWSNGRNFVSSTPAVKEGVKNRFKKEWQDAIKQLS
jgi:hypothetical protein